MRWKTLVRLGLIAAAISAVWWFGPWRTIAHAPGILINSEPQQLNHAPSNLPDVAGWKLRAVADYELRGRVLGTKHYHSGASAELVPIDVAVGWGPMSDTAILDRLTLSMGNRFFFYEWENEPPLSDDVILRNVANNHVIAANDQVRSVISGLRPGHLIYFRGYLVDATKPGEGTWITSRRRDDRGNGACEIFYVETARASDMASTEITGVSAANRSSVGSSPAKTATP
jgi:hypothetical protein